MKSPRMMKWLILLAGLSVLAACSGGGGGSAPGASTMTITVSGGTGTTGGAGTTKYTEGPVNNLGYYDPSFDGGSVANTGTLITMCSGVTGSDPCNVLINIKTAGWTPGGYLITNGTTTPSTYFLYMEQGNYYDSITSEGTITLSSVGSVGEPITGSFDAILGLRNAPSTTIGVSGTFSVIRDH